jgi:hypothetical protein
VTSFFVLTSAEAMATAEAIEALRPLSWSAALLERAGERGGLSTNNMATLFEVRFGRALKLALRPLATGDVISAAAQAATIGSD